MLGTFTLNGKVNQVSKDGADAGIDQDRTALTGWVGTLTSNYPKGVALPDGSDIDYLDIRTVTLLSDGSISEDGVTAGISLTAHDPAVFGTPLQWTIKPGTVTLASGKSVRPKSWTFNAPLAGVTASLGGLTPVAGMPLEPAAASVPWDSVSGKPIVIAAGATAADARVAIGLDLIDLDEWEWFANYAAFPGAGVTDVVYGARDTGKFYRWNGAAYVQVGGSSDGLSVVVYSGSLSAARPSAPAVYWVDFPSTPTNAQAQDIVASSADTVAPAIHAATLKSTPNDADEFALTDSPGSFALRKMTWANIKAVLKVYFDTVATTLTNKTLTGPRIDNIQDVNGAKAFEIGATTTAVNFGYVTPGATAGPVTLGAWGTDTNVDLTLNSKGTGVVKVNNVPAATTTGAQTLTGKTVDLASNTLAGTTAQFNTANTDADFYTTSGTDVAVADGGTGASTAANARTNLGLGTLISEYAGATSLSSQPFPTVGGRTPIGVTVEVMIAPGPGGGSGRRGAAGSVRGGGGGGANGGVLRSVYVPASAFGPNWGLNIPAAGAGGAAVTVNDTNGNNGGTAGDAVFTTGSVVLRAATGDSGKGGTNVGGAASSYFGGSGTDYGVGNNGAAASNTGGPGVSNGQYYNGLPAGGSSGGGITAADVPGAGAAGSFNNYLSGSVGGSGGVVGGASPTAPAAIPGIPGTSAGSGAASTTAAAQAGANGAGYGVGGSGGGASLNGNNSGKGGDGGPGFARLIWDFS